MRAFFISLFIFFSAMAFATSPDYDPNLVPTLKADGEEPEAPWFTGPLLTPAGHVVPAGYVNVEPYFFYTVVDGLYDNDWNSFSVPNFYSALFQFPVFIGLTEWADILFVGQSAWNSTQGASTLTFGDFIVELDFQIVQDTKENSLPGVKLYIQETFPTGRFSNLDGDKLGTDVGGRGSYRTTVGFVITRLFNVWCDNFLSLRFNGFYLFSSTTHVKGFNVYAGNEQTRGKFRPGDLYGALFGLEYNFNRNWAFAFDAQAIYQNETKFSGFPGLGPDGQPLDLDIPQCFQFSIAPALEYNFSESFGIIAGAWFSLAGKNVPRFISGVIAINYFGPSPITSKHKYRSKGGSTSPSTPGGGMGAGF